MLKSFSISLAVLATISFAMPSFAEGSTSLVIAARPSVHNMSEVVQFADLDTDSTAGAKTLLARIHHAAGYACTDYPLSSPDRFINRDACLRTALNKAVTSLHKPVVAALYREESGVDVASLAGPAGITAATGGSVR